MKEAPVHGTVTEHTNSSGVTVRQNRFGTVAAAGLLEPRGNRVQGFIPTDAFECLMLAAAEQWALLCSRLSFQGEKNAVRSVNAVKVLRDFSAQEALSHRLRWIAFNFHGASLLVHRDQHRAGVRAVVGTDGVNYAKWRRRGHGFIVRRMRSDAQSRAERGRRFPK